MNEDDLDRMTEEIMHDCFITNECPVVDVEILVNDDISECLAMLNEAEEINLISTKYLNKLERKGPIIDKTSSKPK